MKLRLWNPDEPLNGVVPVNQRLHARYARRLEAGERRDRISISKTGRLVSIGFAVGIGDLKRGDLTLTEDEILLLAKLSRRGRDNAAFLKAIDDAGESLTEIRKTRRRGQQLSTNIDSQD